MIPKHWQPTNCDWKLKELKELIDWWQKICPSFLPRNNVSILNVVQSLSDILNEWSMNRVENIKNEMMDCWQRNVALLGIMSPGRDRDGFFRAWVQLTEQASSYSGIRRNQKKLDEEMGEIVWYSGSLDREICFVQDRVKIIPPAVLLNQSRLVITQ